MKKVLLADNQTRKTVIVDVNTTTVREIYEDNGMNPDLGVPYLNGKAIRPDKLDDTIYDLAGEAPKYHLIKTVKSDGNF